MTNVVIFSDASLPDTESLTENVGLSNLADTIRELPVRNAGAHRIKTEIRNCGIKCDIIDFLFYFSLDELEKICKRYITKDTAMVGFSTTFWYDLSQNADKASKLRFIIQYTRNLNGPKVVFGGTQATYFSDKIKSDASFDGFAEGALNKYLQSLIPTYRPNPFDFNTSSITYNNEDCLHYGESTVIEISRGCIFKCSFCSYPLNGKNKLDYIKDEGVLSRELMDNYEKFGITTYTLSDDTFNDSMYKLEYMHRVISSLPFKLQFVSYLRLDLINAHRDQIPLLKEIGLIGAFFGVETFNRRAGQAIGKGLDPEKSKELMFDLKDKYWKDDINITVGLISGLPYETLASHNETVDWVGNTSQCLVDRIRPAALSVPNPLIDRYPFKSEFQLNASKYGFYWPDPKSNVWKNMSHEIKTQAHANILAKEIYTAAKNVNKVSKGNFGLPLTANIAKFGHNPKSLDDIIKMNPDMHRTWLEENRSDMVDGYINAYKEKKLKC